jgi:general secretion pathway protein K
VTRTRREEGGFALIAVLLVLAFVAVIGAEFAYSMRLEASAARIYKETLIATHLAEAGIAQATRELVADFAFVSLGDDKDPGNDPDCPLVFYTAARVALKRLPHRNVPLGGGQFTYCITDEEGRFNLNTMLTGDRFVRLLEAMGLERADRDVISDSLLDWKDPNEEHRINGAESEDTYLKLPVPYRSKNGNLDSVSELVQIKGITPAVMEGVDGRRGLVDVVSVWGSSQINVNTAGREVLRALGLSDAQFSDIEQARRLTPDFQTARFPTTGVSLSHQSRTFRIEAQGLVEGQVRARITAIVRKGTNTGNDGITVLEWSGVR